MPVIEFEGQRIECEVGTNLRRALLRQGSSPHNSRARLINCRGLSGCGTCAVRVTGNVSGLTRREWLRLRLPPHAPDKGLRLACQCKVLGDLTVEKFAGFWGHRAGERRALQTSR